MAAIAQIKFWNTSPYPRFEIVNVNIALPRGAFFDESDLTQLAAEDPIGDGLNYVLQSKSYGPRFADGSIKKITAWFAIRINPGEQAGTGSRSSDRYPFYLIYEKIVNIVNTGGLTVSWSPHAQYLTSNNPYGLFDSNLEIDQSTTLLMTLSYGAKELYANYSEVPTLKEIEFKPLQSNIDGTLSDAEEIDIDTVGSTFSRAWKTRIRYYPEHHGGSDHEPSLWAWLILEVPTYGRMSRYWLQYGYGVITQNNALRNNGNNSFLTFRGIHLEVVGPELQWMFENHKIPNVSSTSANNVTTTTTDLIESVDYIQRSGVRADGFDVSGNRWTIFTFSQPHGFPLNIPLGYFDYVRDDTGYYERYYDSYPVSTTQIRIDGFARTFASASVTVATSRSCLIQNGHSQCVTGHMFFYPDTSATPITGAAEQELEYTILAMKYEQGDNPLLWSCMNWADHDSFCAMGVVKKFPAHYTSQQTAKEDAAIIEYNKFHSRRGQRDQWMTEYNGGAPRTGIAGGQPEFGSSKCGHMARCALPDTRTLMLDILQEACRIHHYREHDATILNPRANKYRTNLNVYSDVVFNNGVNFFLRDHPSWQHGLGHNQNVDYAYGAGESNSAGGWQSIQNLHWSWNAMAAAGHLVADRWFREAEVKDAENVWLLGKPVPTIDIVNAFVESVYGTAGADRSEYRYVLTLCQLYTISGKQDLVQRLIDRADPNLNWAVNVADSVYDPDKVSMMCFGDAGSWGGRSPRSAISWMSNMVHHMFAAVRALEEYGDQTSADKYRKLFNRIGRGVALSFFRKNSQTSNIWTVHYYSDYDWDPSTPGRRQDENIYPGCWLAVSGTTGVSQNSPFTGYPFNLLYLGGLLMWGIGTDILLWETMQSDSELKTRLYDMLNGSGSFLPSPTSDERKGSSGWGKTWGDNFDDWVYVIDDPYKSRSLNGVTIPADFIINDWSVFAPNVTQQFIADFVTFPFTLFSPTVKLGVTVTPSAITFDAQVFEPTVHTRQETLIYEPFVVFEPTVQAGTRIRPDPIVWPFTVISTAEAITVGAGITVGVDEFASTVNPSVIVEEFKVFEPTVRLGSDNDPDVITTDWQVFFPVFGNLESDYVRIPGLFRIRHSIRGLLT